MNHRYNLPDWNTCPATCDHIFSDVGENDDYYIQGCELAQEEKVGVCPITGEPVEKYGDLSYPLIPIYG